MDYSIAPTQRGWTPSEGTNVANLQNAAVAPQPPGIASRVGDLQSVVSDTLKMAYNLRCALGIQQPETTDKPTQPPCNLAEMITQMRIALCRANCDFQDVLQHLNS